MGNVLLQASVAGKLSRPMRLMTHDPPVSLYSDAILRI